MKEAEAFSDDPKSAECIRQLEQVAYLFSVFLSCMCCTNFVITLSAYVLLCD